MSVQNLPPNPESEAEPEELTIRRLVRAIDYAEGFWLGFAKSNTPAQRRRLAALCEDLLEPLKIRVLEIELNEPVTDLLPVLRERLAQEANDKDAAAPGHKLAIFVHGLERSIPSREAYPPLLSALNLKRELFRQEVPHPLLLWLPDYALTALARKAPDFWAWRSGLYEFAPERAAAEKSLAAVSGEATHIIASLPEHAKRERLVVLKGLLDDYRELGDGRRERNAQSNILYGIALLHALLGDLSEARKFFKESVAISRGTGNNRGEAISLHGLGNIAYLHGDLDEARRHYDASLEIFKALDDQSNVAISLGQLALIAKEQGAFDEARRLHSENLEIQRGLGDQSNTAPTLHNLAVLAHLRNGADEAKRLYNESMGINRKLGNQNGIALTLYNLGLLASEEGDMAEARQLWCEALSIFEALGSPSAERVRQSLALIEDR